MNLEKIKMQAQTEMTDVLDGVMDVLKQLDGHTCKVTIQDMDRLAVKLIQAGIHIKTRLYLVDTIAAESTGAVKP